MGDIVVKGLFTVTLIALATLPSEGCSKAPARPAPVPDVESPLAVKPLFCAYGGVSTPRPSGENSFASMVIELNNPGAAIKGVTVLGANLLDAARATTASLRRVDHVVVLSPLAKPGPTLGIFAIYLNPEGTPFTGTLPPGRTRLRIRFSLDHRPSAPPARCRLEIGGIESSPLVIEGDVDGSWPT